MNTLKIRSLYLQNVSYMLSALDKTEIFLDFGDITSTINVLIGKMGSGKTVILGHLQPFHSFGTLDSRNQDNMIISGKDGKKVIIYDRGSDEFVITHNYIWERTSHSVKSFIEKNGNELNPNGNQTSFKNIIEYEFGLEQNHLRLLRLGPNVINFINMKATERKSFIASLLNDTAIYSLLYKKWSDELRDLNSKTNVLANKLTHIGADKEAIFKDEYDDNSEEIQLLTLEYEGYNQKIYQLRGECDAILNGSDYITFTKIYEEILSKLKSDIDERDVLNDKMIQYTNPPKLEDITNILGKLDQTLILNNARLVKLEKDHSDTSTELNVLLDNMSMLMNKDYIQTLESTYQELLVRDNEFKTELRGFQCEYTSTHLIGFIGDLQTVNIIIEELSQRNRDDLTKIFNSDSSVIRWAQKKVEILTATKFKIQKQMNNIRYSDNYEASGIMYLPPFCPTKTCPYYATHPYTLKQSQKDDTINEELTSLRNQVDALDIEIYRYSDYSYIYSKMVTLKELWKKAFPTLNALRALRTTSLLQILTNLTSRTWYDYDTLIQCVELCKKRESYYELTENLNKIKNELNVLKLSEGDNNEEKITSHRLRLTEMQDEIISLETSNRITSDEIQKYNLIYLDLSQLSIWQDSVNNLNTKIQLQCNELAKIEKNKENYATNLSIIESLQSSKIIPLRDNIKKYTSRNEEIKSVLNDIKYTKKDFDSAIEEREYMKLIINAVSSKEGVPLVMIMKFLNNCRHIVNDLIYDIFEDDVEIQEFKITETDFKIPFTKNGILIDDIEKASQGQRSIISLALSFALVRQSDFQYNIMLLDEVDGSLYTSDRNKFISILFKQIKAIGSRQVFLISHNNTFDGFPVNIIMTTDEIVEKTNNNTIMKV